MKGRPGPGKADERVAAVQGEPARHARQRRHRGGPAGGRIDHVQASLAGVEEVDPVIGHPRRVWQGQAPEQTPAARDLEEAAARSTEEGDKPEKPEPAGEPSRDELASLRAQICLQGCDVIVQREAEANTLRHLLL